MSPTNKGEYIVANNNSTGSISFPYASMDQAIQDKFARVGGASEAYRFMVNGYKGGIWRKSSQEKRQDKVKAALKLMEEYEKKNGKKADRQLGREGNV